MQFKDILYNIESEYAHVTINRPKVLNAFTPETLQELKSALDMAERDKNHGLGEKCIFSFCVPVFFVWFLVADFREMSDKSVFLVLQCRCIIGDCYCDI